MSAWLSFSLTLLVGCGDFRKPIADDSSPVTDSDADTDTDADADSDADTDTDTDTDADTDADTDTDTTDWLTGVVECPPSEPPENVGYQELPIEGMTAKRYCLTEDHVSGYRNREGKDPAFYVVTPTTFADPTAAHPVLVYLHGGVVGVDENDAGNRFCFYSRNEGTEAEPLYAGTFSLINNAVYNGGTILEFTKRNDWIYVVPESDWCDLWSGMGEYDPVDTNHRSLQHVETVLDVLGGGLDGLTIDEDQIFAWGTSIGAEGAWVVAGGYAEDPHPIAAIVPDSGPFYTTAWYTAYGSPYSDYGNELDDIVGGDPYESDGVTPSVYYANYERFDVRLLMERKGVRTPAFLAWNSEDRIVEPDHGPYAAAALDEIYGAEGVRYFYNDFDHHAPDGRGHNYHTQTPNEGIPWTYNTAAAVDFLRGAAVQLFQAESFCDDGICEIVNEADPEFCPGGTTSEDCWGTQNRPASMTSGTTAIRRSADGAGVLFKGVLPTAIPRGVPLQIRLILQATDISAVSPSTELVLVTVKQGSTTLGTLEIPRSSFADEGADVVTSTLVDQVELTSLDTDFGGDGVREGLPSGTVTLILETAGLGTILFDGIYVSTL